MGGFADPFSCHDADQLVAELIVVVVVELLPDLLLEEVPAEGERVLQDPQDDVGAMTGKSLTNRVVVVFTRIDPRTIENIIDDLQVFSARRVEEDPVVDRNLRRVFHEPLVDLPVSPFAGRGDHTGGCRIVSEKVLKHFEMSVLCSVGDVLFGHLEVGHLENALEDRKVSVLDRESDQIRFVKLKLDDGTGILEETLKEIGVSPLGGAHESFGDGNGGMRACEDRFKFVHAAVLSKPLKLLGLVLGLNLAKERILLGSAVETAEACNRLRIVLGDEITYELHLDTPEIKIRPANQSVFIQSSTLYPSCYPRIRTRHQIPNGSSFLLPRSSSTSPEVLPVRNGSTSHGHRMTASTPYQSPPYPMQIGFEPSTRRPFVPRNQNTGSISIRFHTIGTLAGPTVLFWDLFAMIGPPTGGTDTCVRVPQANGLLTLLAVGVQLLELGILCSPAVFVCRLHLPPMFPIVSYMDPFSCMDMNNGYSA
jgi:hypothetical protein